MKITTGFILLLLTFALTSFADAQKSFNDKDLPKFAEVHANLFRGGQPTENGVKELAKRGVKTIIDLRGADEHSKKEENWARNNGIKFVAVNLSNWFKPKDSDIENIIKQIDAADNQPVFVHCQRGADRTGTVIAVYRLTHDDYTVKQAVDEAKKFKFGWWQFWMKDYIEDYARKMANKKTGIVTEARAFMPDWSADTLVRISANALERS